MTFECLFELKDTEYKAFYEKLIPNIDKERIIGVRVPKLRRLASKIVKEGKSEEFIRELPHYYLEENYLHAFILDIICKDYEKSVYEIERFLPFVDNWAVCDSLIVKALLSNKEDLLKRALNFLKSTNPYEVRFSLVLLMKYYLGEDFDEKIVTETALVSSDNYYVNMALAWFLSQAIIERREQFIYLFEEKRLEKWVHNKAIQKVTESRKADSKLKNELRKLKY